MSVHDPHGSPQSTVGGDLAPAPEPRPAVGHREGFSAGQNGYGNARGQPYGYQNSPQRVGSQPGVSVGFVEAIKRFYAKYTQFTGRASRSEYWWVALYLGAVYLVLSVLSSAGSDAAGQPNGFGVLISILLLIFAVGHVVPSIAIGIRRLHDVSLSGWFYLLSLIPFVGGLILIMLMVLPPKPEGARFDR